MFMTERFLLTIWSLMRRTVDVSFFNKKKNTTTKKWQGISFGGIEKKETKKLLAITSDFRCQEPLEDIHSRVHFMKT